MSLAIGNICNFDERNDKNPFETVLKTNPKRNVYVHTMSIVTANTNTNSSE